MGRPPLYPEKILVQFEPGTLARLTDVLADDEERATFIRTAVEREIKRRERKGALPAKAAAAKRPSRRPR